VLSLAVCFCLIFSFIFGFPSLSSPLFFLSHSTAVFLFLSFYFYSFPALFLVLPLPYEYSHLFFFSVSLIIYYPSLFFLSSPFLLFLIQCLFLFFLYLLISLFLFHRYSFLLSSSFFPISSHFISLSPSFNVENVNLRGYKWNETVRNRIHYVSNRICNVNNEICNTCATSYITADNSRPTAYFILKVICKWKNKDCSIQKRCVFYSQNNCTMFKQLPKTCNNFPNFTDFQPPATAKPEEMDRTYCEWNTSINARFSKMQSVLVHRLRFTSYDHLFVTNTASSIPLFSGWRNTIGIQLTDVTTN
jgi:Fe-S-cluster containining protein